MSKRFSNYILLFFIGVIMLNCANRGTPQGGPKDETPPEILNSEPENFSVGFDTDEITITFDEYVRVKDLQKNLIISPPMKTLPEITPLGSASKEINIKIFDTLLPNTTYAFNFGESIVDNNESNPYPFYKYVFSTGSYIDSLSVGGVVTDAFDKKPEEFVSVMLYEVDSTFTDSIIYKEKPKYITNTLDSTSTFQLENLKAGKYLMIALKDNNSNYTFEQSEDKIGFIRNFITIPTDSVYSISLFKEEINFKALRAKLISGNKIAFGVEGSAENVKIKPLFSVPDNFKFQIKKDAKSDSLHLFYNPHIKQDSLVFKISKNNIIDTVTVRIRELPKDSLIITNAPKGIIDFLDTFKVKGNVPFVNYDTTKIKLINKDSIPVSYTASLDTINNTFEFNFNKEEEQLYRFQFLPGAFTDIFEHQNDTLNYKVTTRTKSDYGNVRLTLKNATYPVIVQLTNEKGEMKYEKYLTDAELLDFRDIKPAKYMIRILFDSNKNGKYDSGNYLKKEFPERVSYYPDILDVRAGWDYIEEFILK